MELDPSVLPEFAPLFEIGIYEKTMPEFEIWVKEQFSNSETRNRIFRNFQTLIAKIQAFNISFEVWVDGSFLTTKPEPKDIDLLILAKKRDVNKLPLEKQDKFYGFFSYENTQNIKALYNCDTGFIIREKKRDYDFWYEWFSKSRSGQTKGFICIKF